MRQAVERRDPQPDIKPDQHDVELAETLLELTPEEAYRRCAATPVCISSQKAGMTDRAELSHFPSA